jgi:CO/xanthine dehydrogenase Mo-binding subunit
MELLAKKLGIDPFEFRRTNVLRTNSSTATGQKLEASVGAEATLKAIEPYYRDAVSWASAPQPQRSPAHFKRGVGISSIFFGIGEAGWKNPSKIGMRLTPDGWIEMLVGAADMGQGVFSTLAQIAAETLDLPMDCIRILTPDTDVTPNAGSTEASRQTMVSGLATQQAAASLKKALESVSPSNRAQEPLRKRLSYLHDVCVKEGIPVEHFGYYKPAIQPIDGTGRGKPHLVYAFASHVAQVEVDVESGFINVVRLVAAHDIGKAVNPLTLEGQIEGGLMMALGFALKEEFKPGITRKWSHYKLPRTTDLPEIVNLLVEEQTPEGPFGAKGVGEVPAVGPAAAIVNAVANACGVRASRLPLTPAQFGADRKASQAR